jgi:hypothetical protein
MPVESLITELRKEIKEDFKDLRDYLDEHIIDHTNRISALEKSDAILSKVVWGVLMALVAAVFAHVKFGLK